VMTLRPLLTTLQVVAVDVVDGLTENAGHEIAAHENTGHEFARYDKYLMKIDTLQCAFLLNFKSCM